MFFLSHCHMVGSLYNVDTLYIVTFHASSWMALNSVSVHHVTQSDAQFKI